MRRKRPTLRHAVVAARRLAAPADVGALGAHGAELADDDDRAAGAEARLAKEDRAGGIEPHRERDERHQRRDREEQEERPEAVHHRLEPPGQPAVGAAADRSRRRRSLTGHSGVADPGFDLGIMCHITHIHTQRPAQRPPESDSDHPRDYATPREGDFRSTILIGRPSTVRLGELPLSPRAIKTLVYRRFQQNLIDSLMTWRGSAPRPDAATGLPSPAAPAPAGKSPRNQPVPAPPSGPPGRLAARLGSGQGARLLRPSEGQASPQPRLPGIRNSGAAATAPEIHHFLG